jgi:hypothetical protein
MTSELFQNLNRLSDEEISLRVKGGYYSDEANNVAVEILKSRGLAVPEVIEGYIEPKVPFRKSHPIWFWTFVGAFGTAFGRLIKQWIQS